MDEFSFTVVVIGVVIGLSIATVLRAFADMLEYRQQVRLYWVHVVWMCVVFLVAIHYWFNLLDHKVITRNFLCFLSSLIFPLVVYIATALLVPRLQAGHPLDCKQYYYRHSSWFFLLATIGMVHLMLNDTLMLGMPLLTGRELYRAVGAAAMIALTISRREKLHCSAAIVLTALYVTYIITYTRRSLG